MVLMAVLRIESRLVASRLFFWIRKVMSRLIANARMMMISRRVSPFLLRIFVL